MPTTDRFRPTRPVTRAIADEIKQLMKNAPQRVTQIMAAEALERDQAYVSERLSAKRAFTTDDLDVLAPLLGMTITELWHHLGSLTSPAAPTVSDLSDLATIHPIREEAPTDERLAAKRGRRKADEPPAD